MIRVRSSLMLASSLLVACADTPETLAPSPAPAIVQGADGRGTDRADTACAVVLRDVARIPDGMGGYASLPPDGRYVWEGHIDVDAGLLASGATPSVLFATTETGGEWYAAPAGRIAEIGRYVRFAFRIDAFTPRAGMSTTSLTRSVIRLIPYVATGDTRLFDHNRLADVLATYTLDAENLWTVAADETCPTHGDDGIPRWSFTYPDFAESLRDGPLVGGAQVRVAYDGRRLRATQGCMGAHGPVSGTTLFVHAMIDGDPARVTTAEVERYAVGPGSGCGSATSCVTQRLSEPLLDLPADSADLAVWFTCVPGFDQAPNLRYDSNDGANYHLPIAPPARAVDWMGAWGLYRARPGDVLPLTEPFAYGGFSNMGFAVQAEVWTEGVAPASLVVEVESDALTCTPGAPTRERLALAASDAGPFGHNALYRWGFESLLGRCAPGSYRFRILASADGGLTFSALGAAAESTPESVDPSWRTLENRPR